MRSLVLLGIVGLVAQLVDGSLGMAYGVTSSTMLLAVGVAPAAASAAVHFSEIGTTLDVDEIKQRLRDFPDAVKAHPFPYSIEVATYDTIPLPLPTPAQQDAFLLAFTDAEARKLKYLQARNDCQFAAEHPEFFLDPPGKSALSVAFNDRCDMIVATAVLPHDRPATIEPGVMAFLNSKPVLHWAEVAMGI